MASRRRQLEIEGDDQLFEQLAVKGRDDVPGQRRSGAQKVQSRRSGVARAIHETVEIFDRHEEIKRLLYEVYDKVNIDRVLDEGYDGLDTDGFGAVIAEKRRMQLKRYIRALKHLNADSKDIAKLLALWHGDIHSDALGKFSPLAQVFVQYAGDFSKIDEIIDDDCDPLTIYSSVHQNFQRGAVAQWGHAHYASSATIRHEIRQTTGVYRQIHNYVAEDFELSRGNISEKVSCQKRLVKRTAQELADLVKVYRGSSCDFTVPRERVFKEVAATLLYIWKSGYVNVVTDGLVNILVAMVLKGADERNFQEAILLFSPLNRKGE